MTATTPASDHSRLRPQPPRRAIHAAAVAMSCAVALTACGGGGGGGDDGGGGGGNTTFTIGGRVDGLTGTGLVLQNSGGNNLSISAAGAFQFTQAVAQGAAYNVTVSTQPAGQACAVANGTGTANAAVNNIVVTCSAPLTLQSSTPAANATGVDRSAALTLGFSAPVDVATVAANVTLSRAGQAVAVTAAGSGSTVTVNPQAPLMPLARYTLAAATGLRGSGGQTLGAAASVSFTTRDGAWQGAQRVSADGASASNAQLAFDAAGNAMAVWEQFDRVGGRFSIWASRFLPGTGWGTPVLVETDNVGNAVDPQIVIDSNGNALAVWSQFDGTRYNIWANRYTAGTGWGTAVPIETAPGGASDPRIAIDTNGNALAVWLQDDGTRINYVANRYAVGTGWGNATLIGAGSATGTRAPQIATGVGGNAMAVWSQSDGTRYNIWANRYTPGAGWGTAALIETDNSGNAVTPQIATDANGNAIAVWSQSDGSGYNIWANRYTPGTGWGTAARIENSDETYAEDPKIAFDASGNALTVWRQYDGTRYNLWASRYTSGTGWGTAVRIEINRSGDAGEPQIAIDPNGNALTVWRQVDRSQDSIWFIRYTAGTGWGTPALIETDNAISAGSPQIAIDASGNALAVWQQLTVMSNRFQ